MCYNEYMTNDEIERCRVEVGEPPGYWHWHDCDRPVKFTITTSDGETRGVCGTHKRAHDRNALHSKHFKTRS